MKFIEDVDTGELIPIPDNSEEEAINNIPRFVKDDFPEIRIKSDGTNEIISDLCDQLKEEKANKTVYHKFPFLKIITSAIVIAVIAVFGFFGIRYVSNINIEPFTVDISSTVSEESAVSEEDDDESFIDYLLPKVLPALSLLLTVTGVRFTIKFVQHLIING